MNPNLVEAGTGGAAPVARPGGEGGAGGSGEGDLIGRLIQAFEMGVGTLQRAGAGVMARWRSPRFSRFQPAARLGTRRVEDRLLRRLGSQLRRNTP
jgi:hypothetical protein